MKRLFLCALVLLLGTAGQGVHAQQVRSLEVRDGQVYLDGRRITESELPPSLDVEGVEARYRFSGDVQPVVELNGRLYRLETEGLSELSEADAALLSKEGAFPFHAPLRTPGAAVHFDVGLPTTPSLWTQRPQIEARNYLNDIRRQDLELYEQLVQEHELELTTQALAAEIRALQEGEVRRAKTRELRAKLEEIFELKQENRRREIQQLEIQLQALRRRLGEREHLRRRIIDERLRQLIEQEAPPRGSGE